MELFLCSKLSLKAAWALFLAVKGLSCCVGLWLEPNGCCFSFGIEVCRAASDNAPWIQLEERKQVGT